MSHHRVVRHRFWFETALAVFTASLMILTLAWKDWIEEIFGVDPDKGNGAAEWAITAGFALLFVAAAIAARHEWRRPVVAAAPPL
jgi:hypothetical protein